MTAARPGGGATTITRVWAREILDSRGRPTVEVDIELSDGSLGRASVPSGASTGRNEAQELRDGDHARYGGLGVRGAVGNVVETIAPAIAGCDPFDQPGLDRLLIELDGTPDKSRLGANAILGVSAAVARAAASARRLPLWRYLSRGGEAVLPLPMVNIVSGGLHASGALAFQDFLIIPIGAASYREALETGYDVRAATGDLLVERGLSILKADEGGFGPALVRPEAVLDLLESAVRRAGRIPGSDVALAIDVAASHFFSDGAQPGAFVDRLENLVDRYPIVSIEDGLDEDDWEGWAELTRRLGHRVQLLGDDLFTTNPARLDRGIDAGVANAVLVKMNQIGTVTETVDVIERAHAAGYATVVSARSGETEDSFLADFAVATAAGQIKIGSLAQSERLSKYNQLLRIEEELGHGAPFAGARALARGSSALSLDP
jgi:enolase